ncbi:nucleotidyltransferase domain-containing protein [Candidatus Bathyarchaeota archaeon]|nr:nucleotidyltransferase domain-containing protein [Candidatus Bathyarchaeota archaeon]MBS7627289.1 nucleotidyltransferase domain-containing protein [Candidatus Bathyarchaeota archaeon]
MVLSYPSFVDGKSRDLMCIAKEAAQRILELRGDVIALYLAGSVARGDATPTSDIDLGAIISQREHSEVLKPPLFIKGVQVSCRLIPRMRLMDIRRIWLEDPILPFQILESIRLYDPEDILLRFKQRLEAFFKDKHLFKERIKRCLGFAEERGREVLEYLGHGISEERGVASLLYAILYGIGPAILMKAEVPPSQRRFLLRLEEACEVLDEPHLYRKVLQILGLENVSETWALGAPSILEELHKKTSYTLFRFCKPLYHKGINWLDRRTLDYVKAGAMELSVIGKHAAAVFCCMPLGARCLDLVEESAHYLPMNLRLEILIGFRRLFDLLKVDTEEILERAMRLKEVIQMFPKSL